MHRFPAVGLRIIKTSISVMLCLLLAYWLRQPPPVFACMAAVIVTKENIEQSLNQSAARILSTIVGCLFAIAIMFINAENMLLHILLIGFGCALTIYFCVLIKHPDTAALSAIIFLSLAITHPDDKYIFALTRLVETLVGIVVAIGVNALVRRRRGKRDVPRAPGKDERDGI